ncbi:MAG: TonB-dependent siderophore receptor [Burkholderiales bacterium]|nr:TonB-dependent siderophore receptor [Burkholderiales bacterium]
MHQLTAAVLLTLGAGSVAAQQTLPAVTISDRAAPQEEPSNYAEFGGLPLRELPLSITVLSARELRNQGVDSLSEAIRRDPAASDAYNTVGYVETIQLRGFQLDPLLNYRRNGLPVSAYTPFSLVTKQQIEIQKGLNGVVTGPSSPGGTVNFVTKRATIDISEASLDLSERGTWLAAADFGRRTSDSFGYRFNAALGQRHPHARDADGEQGVFGAAVDWRGPAGIRAQAEFELANSRQISVPGFGLLDRDGDGVAETVPAPIDPRLNLNNQPWSQPFESRSRIGTASLAIPLSERWTITISGLLQATTTNDRLAFPDGCSSGPNYVYPGLCGNYDVDIYDYRSEDERRNTRGLDVALEGQLVLAGMQHRLRLAPRTTRYSERLQPLQAYNFVGTINALAPTPLPADPSLTSLNTDRDLRIDDVQLSDTIDLTDRWRLFAGTRLVRVQAASWRSDGSRALRFSQSAATPWLALSYAPAPDQLLYASWNQGFEPEAVPNRPLRYTNAGQVLPVTRSTQAEVGWRGQLGAAHAVSLALFNIRRPRAQEQQVSSDPNLPNYTLVAEGQQARHRGVEIDWTWTIDRKLRLLAQAMVLDAEIDRSLDPALTGKRASNVPEAAGALQLDWSPSALRGLQVSNRIYASGQRAIGPDNAAELPSWWEWNAWLTVPLKIGGLNTQWRAGIDNITDRRFWREAPTQYWGGTYLFPGQPRTFRLGVSVLL